MNCIRKIFELVGSYGIIGPHDGYVRDLLLCGAKPIGVICVLENPSPENMPIKKRDLADISLLQAAVEDGKLCEEKLIWPNFLGQEGNKLTAHFFCQIDGYFPTTERKVPRGFS